jgi:3-oxoacyl-[acyl-carrier-protein] synthase-3
MITKFTNKTISSVLTVFPQQEIDFMDEMNNYNYSELKMKKLKKLMGYNTRRCGKKVRAYPITPSLGYSI